MKAEQYPPHRRSPGVARRWLWAGLARQASGKRWAQHRDQNRARCWALGLTHAAWKGKIQLSDRGRLLRRGALSKEGENCSAQDSSFTEAVSVHFKPPEPTSCRGCHLSAGFHTQTATVGIHVVTPGSQKADRKAESDPTVCFHSYQVQMQAKLI